MIIGYAGGATNFFLWYNIPIPPIGNGLAPIYMGMMTYAILKYRAMDIEVIIKRTIVFAGLMAFVMGVISAVSFIIQDALNFLGLGRTASLVFSVFIIVVSYDPIRKFLINTTDKYLFQKKYNYQRLLKDASRGLSRIKSLDHMLKLVIHFVTMKMRLDNAAVLAKAGEDGVYKLVYKRGYRNRSRFSGYSINSENPLINYFTKHREALDIDTVIERGEKWARKREKGGEIQDTDYGKIKEEMQKLQAACCIPSFLGHNLQNVLVLGNKRSGNIYTEEDLNVLYTLAQEAAIAVENARLYDEAIKKSEKLSEINEELNAASEKLARALNETEEANKKLQDTQAQLVHEQKMATVGRLASSVGHEVNNPLTILSMNISRILLKLRKDPELKVNDILEFFSKMEDNVQRIKAVVNTLTGILKKHEKGKIEPLNLRLIIEETLPLVRFQTYLDNLTGTRIDIDIPSDLPLVQGNLERLQEVFLNLFINAFHAMVGVKERLIKISAKIDPLCPTMVRLDFKDNGNGMDEEVMKKAFNFRFTTKKKGKGSGLGLYMCRYIMELHGGEIKITGSGKEEGTTFTLSFPIYKGELHAETVNRR